MSWFTSKKSAATRKFQPSIEGLEARWTPASQPVSSFALSGGGVPGKVMIAPTFKIVNIPVVSLPGGGVPGMSLSGGGVPGKSVTGGGVPGLSLTGGGVPGASLGGGGVPGFSLGGGGVPGSPIW